MFINFTNHPSSSWEDGQKEAAKVYGNIVDISFPVIPPKSLEKEVEELAENYVKDILEKYPKAVLCQGEYTFVYQVVKKLKENGIVVLAACSERKVKEENNRKIVEFQFERFRKY